MRSVGEAEGHDGRDSTSTQRLNNASVHILIPLLLYNIFQAYGLGRDNSSSKRDRPGKLATATIGLGTSRSWLPTQS